MLEYKFTKGDRVVVLPTAENSCAPTGATGTFNEYDSIHAWFFIDDEYKVCDIKHVCIEEYDLALIEQPNKTAEEIAPTLWQSYCNVLNEEALAALRQVIEDVENHEKIRFVDREQLSSSFVLEYTKQGYDFWMNVDIGLYNKAEENIIHLERNADGNLSLKEAIHLTGTVNPVQAGVPIPVLTGEMPCWGKVAPNVTKESNPKDAIGVKKVPMSVLPANVLADVALGLFEGARKYGRHNYRVVGVRSSVYYDATLRHLMSWWEGQDIDDGSGLSHVTKAISSLVVLRDAMMQDMLTDDRPPSCNNQHWVDDMNTKASEIIDKYPDAVPAYTKEQ